MIVAMWWIALHAGYRKKSFQEAVAERLRTKRYVMDL